MVTSKHEIGPEVLSRGNRKCQSVRGKMSRGQKNMKRDVRETKGTEVKVDISKCSTECEAKHQEDKRT